MNKQKTAALLTATALLLTTVGCTPFELTATSDGNETEIEVALPVERFDIDNLKQQIADIQDIWTRPNISDDLTEQIQQLLAAVDEAFAVNARAEIAYHADWQQDNLYELKRQTHEDYYVVIDMVTWAFANGYKNSAYPDLFEPYIEEAWINYYTLNSLPRIMSYARSDASESEEILDKYYDSAYDENLDVDETNRVCAKLYLETLEANQTSDYFYSLYGRDYTVEQASAVYHEIVEKLMPLYRELYAYLTEDRHTSRILDNQDVYDIDAYALLKEYAPKLSLSIAESTEKLFDEQLYTAASGENCYDGSYTIALTNEHSALMYTYLEQDFYDLITVSHEFGHFHSDWRDSTPVFLQTNCTDFAEVQSQGMEMLFTSFYDEIFGEEAEYLELIALYNTLESIVSGFAIGEFEYMVMQQQDEIKPKEVLEIFSEIAETCDISLELYQVSHLFEQPGYYVSYGVSALPALQLYAMMQEDFDSALSVYEKISSVSSLSGEYQFCSAIDACGMDNIFDPETLDHIISVVAERIEMLSVH